MLSNTQHKANDFSDQAVQTINLQQRIRGIFLGVALGDALGLPVETLSAEEIASRFGRVRSFLDLRNNPLLAASELALGSTSDDFQLTCAVSRALQRSGGKQANLALRAIAAEHVAELQQTDLGWGGSSREAILRLSRGVPWHLAGQTDNPKRGFGNGIPIKIAPLVLYAVREGLSAEQIEELVAGMCAMTHPTSMAVSAGLAHVAALQYCLASDSKSFNQNCFIDAVVAASAKGRRYFEHTLGADDLTDRLNSIRDLLAAPPEEVIAQFGGAGCYVYDSLPSTYYLFLRDPWSSETLFDFVNAGGDTDSNAGMGAALLGALNGADIFPKYLLMQLPCRAKALREAACWL